MRLTKPYELARTSNEAPFGEVDNPSLTPTQSIMILVKDLLGVAYDAATLATVDPDVTDLGSIAERGALLELIKATAAAHDRYTLTDLIPSERIADLSDALGRGANAADYIDGSGWEAVVQWAIDLLPSGIRDVEA